jgi:hypothetical protein
MRGRIDSAHLLALIAIVLAVGGNAAAFTLGKNSVGAKQLKKNAVTKVKIKKNAVNGSKVMNNSLTGADINLSKLGTVPSAKDATTAGTANSASVANSANVADVANSLSPSEGWHEVGASGEPALLNSWHNEPGLAETAAFYKDQLGIVHLKGLVKGGSAPQVFRLPVGYRPAAGKLLTPIVSCVSGLFCGSGVSSLSIRGSGLSEEGEVSAPLGATLVGFDGVTFRAES